MKQTIKVGATGSDSRRVLEVLTPLNGNGAPAIHAEFVGQVYIDDAGKKVYVSIDTDSVAAADDWQLLVPASTIMPLYGAGAPAVNAAFFGQLYIDTTGDFVYVAIAVDSAAPADDWKKIAAAV